MDIFIQNKYTKWYDNIINKSALRGTINEYTEKHHVIPKSLGGCNNKSNIAVLTAKEHFICHWLLTKMIKTKKHKNQMQKASWCMMMKSEKHNRQYTAAQYAKAKQMLSEAQKGHKHYGPFVQSEESNRARSEKLKGRTLPPKTAEHRLKISISKTNPSDETRLKISIAAKNRVREKHTEETKLKMSQWQKGIPKPKVECEYCGFCCSKMNYKRWHGSNCKHHI